MNAKQEFTDLVRICQMDHNSGKVLCVLMTYFDHYSKDGKDFALKLGHTSEQMGAFLNQIDFEYEDNFGSQMLYGTIWFEDGTWVIREEYDGSEWWKHVTKPAIPFECVA